MSIPALRQPKFVTEALKQQRKLNSDDYVILTMKSDIKLVITSDAYNGIITEDIYKCVFCESSMDLDSRIKEMHKDSVLHKVTMHEVQYLKGFADNLVRKLNKNNNYCTICNVTLPSYSTARHVSNEGHKMAFTRALNRAYNYKPADIE